MQQREWTSELSCYMKVVKHRRLQTIWTLSHEILEKAKLWWQNQISGLGLEVRGRNQLQMGIRKLFRGIEMFYILIMVGYTSNCIPKIGEFYWIKLYFSKTGRNKKLTWPEKGGWAFILENQVEKKRKKKINNSFHKSLNFVCVCVLGRTWNSQEVSVLWNGL